MYVSKDWKKEDIIELLKIGKSNEDIKELYPSISTATLASYRKKIAKAKELKEMELKVAYATQILPERFELDDYLKQKWEEFVKKVFPLIEILDAKIEERIKNDEISTRDLISYKINLLTLMSKGSK